MRARSKVHGDRLIAHKMWSDLGAEEKCMRSHELTPPRLFSGVRLCLTARGIQPLQGASRARKVSSKRLVSAQSSQYTKSLVIRSWSVSNTFGARSIREPRIAGYWSGSRGVRSGTRSRNAVDLVDYRVGLRYSRTVPRPRDHGAAPFHYRPRGVVESERQLQFIY